MQQYANYESVRGLIAKVGQMTEVRFMDVERSLDLDCNDLSFG